LGRGIALGKSKAQYLMAADKTAKQQRGRPFKPGKSGNPAGKPKGVRNKATIVLEAILDGDAPTLMRKAVEMAKAGDGTMMRLCLERLLPPRKDRPVEFSLPEIGSSADAAKAMLAIVQVVAAGEVTPSEAFELSRIIESFAETLKVNELEQRIETLETKI
jgi:Family of unknown function (DUF5681)